MTNDASITREFHTETKLHDGPGGFDPKGHPEGFKPMDPENRPAPFKRYPDAPRIALPAEIAESEASALDVLSGTAPRSSQARLGTALLARLLFYSTGVTRTRSTEDGTVVGWFRAAPAAGNLHPVETYVVCGDLDEIPAAIYHFGPGDFSLETVREGDRRAALAAAVADDSLSAAPVSLVLTGVPWRTGWKYTARGFRHIYWDAGSLLAQTLAVAEAAGIPAQVRLGFVDSAISVELGIDGISEFPVAVVSFGVQGEAAADGDAGPLVGGDPERASSRPYEFPLVTQTQHAGDLTDAVAVDQWRKSASTIGRSAREPVDDAPPASETSALSIEELVRRRGSTRMFRPEEISEQAARWALGVASRPVPSDFCAAGQTLLAHHVSVHQVAGVPAGRHEWIDGDLKTGVTEDETAARREAQRLCLGQALGGDSAFSVFHSIDLDGVLEALGDRGYRAGQLEAGLAAGRLQLAAFAVGLGGTGLTFFDDAVPGAFATRDACMLVTAVGASDYRSRAGGLPGRPTEMSGFAPSVVERFKARYEKDEG